MKVVRKDDAETISVPLIGGLKDIERRLSRVIERCRGNKAEAARVWGCTGGKCIVSCSQLREGGRRAAARPKRRRLCGNVYS